VATQVWGWRDVRDIARCSRLLGRDNLRDNILPKLAVLKDHGYAGNGMRLLDVGCGPGAFLRAAREAGFDVCGLEPAWLPSLWGRRKLGLDIRTVKLEQFKPENNFDVVVCLHVIEHIPDPVRALKRMSDLCKSDGIVMLATPNLGCQKAREMGVKWEAVGPADHLFLFDGKSLRMLAERSGLDVLECTEQEEEITALCCPGALARSYPTSTNTPPHR
jgi:2-polyprenyl-3-methyl-5-hydroxy-6-metoxy-1,4-benzoquinol methylase